MEIAYIIEVMFNSGGMERVLSVCANSLCHELDVNIVTLYQKGRPAYFPLDNRIHCYDLGLDGVANRKLLKSRLSRFLMTHHFDIVISLGGMDMYYLHSIQDRSKKMVWFHFAYNVAYTAWSGDSPSVIRKARGYLQQVRRILHARKYDRVIAISNADYHAWQKYTKKATMIYNPITIHATAISERKEKKIISVGRLDHQKGYDYLVAAWSLVKQKHPDWHLDVYGEGSLRDSIQKQINELKLTDVITLCGRTPNIGEKYASHSIYVMSSRTEALGLVLLEAASCGLPLIAYNCPFGPRDVIENGKNGLLVERVGDIQGMADAICTLIENESLRNEMGEKARQMVERFSITNITRQWMDLFMV